MWTELFEAKKKSLELSQRLDKLLREHSSLSKKEIELHAGTLLGETDEAIADIEEMYRALAAGLKNHRKTLAAKEKFLKRHYRRS